jgi:hypothetical protein
MSESVKNQPVLREAVKTMLAPLIAEISTKLSTGTQTAEQLKDNFKAILKDDANQAIFKQIKNHYSNNIQQAYEYILHNIKVTDDARRVITSAFKKPDSPIALAFGKEYQPTKKPETVKSNKTSGINSWLFSSKGFILDGGLFDEMVGDAHKFNMAVFNTAVLTAKVVAGTGRAAWETAKFGGKVVSKASNAANNIVSFSRKATPVASGSPRTPPPTP